MKKATMRPLVSKTKTSAGGNGSESLFRETGARGGTLAGLEHRIRLANHVNGTFALNHLAICMAAFCGGEG
jgi:hypothetical protein